MGINLLSRILNCENLTFETLFEKYLLKSMIVIFPLIHRHHIIVYTLGLQPLYKYNKNSLNNKHI